MIGPAVTTISAPASASSQPEAASARSPMRSTRSGCGSQARISTSGFSACSRPAWNLPCSPQPRIAARRQPSGAKRRTQTPLAAAVRAAVISAPSITAKGQARLGVVQDDEPCDVRQPACLVRRIAAYPLERDDVLVPQVRGHGVEERVLARVHAGLGRQLHASRGERAVRVLDQVELLGDLGKERRHIGAAQVEQSAQRMDTGSTTTLTRDSPGLCPWYSSFPVYFFERRSICRSASSPSIISATRPRTTTRA